jgi:hypothetical protein
MLVYVYVLLMCGKCIHQCICLFHYYNTANEDFVSHNTNLVFRSVVIYNFIKYVLNISVNKSI